MTQHEGRHSYLMVLWLTFSDMRHPPEVVETENGSDLADMIAIGLFTLSAANWVRFSVVECAVRAVYVSNYEQ